jgi:hypothetical protein
MGVIQLLTITALMRFLPYPKLAPVLGIVVQFVGPTHVTESLGRRDNPVAASL